MTPWGWAGAARAALRHRGEQCSGGTFAEGPDHSNRLYIAMLYYVILDRDYAPSLDRGRPCRGPPRACRKSSSNIPKANASAARRVAQTIYKSIAHLRKFPKAGRIGLAENARELVFCYQRSSAFISGHYPSVAPKARLSQAKGRLSVADERR